MENKKLNDRITTNYALKIDSDEEISWDVAIKGVGYSCPKCKKNVIFKRGPLLRYFTHLPSDQTTNRCKYFCDHDSNINPIEENHVVNHRLEPAIQNKLLCNYCFENGRNIGNLAIDKYTHFNVILDCSMNICGDCYRVKLGKEEEEARLKAIPKRLCRECKITHIPLDEPSWKTTCKRCYARDLVPIKCISCPNTLNRKSTDTWKTKCINCYYK